jgi:SOS-response transcriptional repressor LexA
LNYWNRKPPQGVVGDSMIEAHICDGAIAIFHPGITGGNGIFVVAIGSKLVIK